MLSFQQRAKCIGVLDLKKQNHDGSVAKSAVFPHNWATLTL